MTVFPDRTVFFIALGLLLSFISAPSLQARNIIAVPADYTTIQDAVDRAELNDTVMVGDGYYRENIVIDKPLMLISRNGHEKTVIEARKTDEDVISIVGVDGAAIIGFTVKGSAHAGVHLYEAAGNRISDNNIEKNHNGLFIEYSKDNSIRNNVSKRNTQGIYLFYSDGNSIEKNSADSNTDKGIVLHASHGNTLRDNTANANYWNGITLTSSHRNIIEDNRVVRNTYSIVMSDSRENKLVNNTTMRRLHLIIPVVLIYLGIGIYLAERRLLLMYYKRKSG
jgi:parallel beta-helix repeat protein